MGAVGQRFWAILAETKETHRETTTVDEGEQHQDSQTRGTTYRRAPEDTPKMLSNQEPVTADR